MIEWALIEPVGVLTTDIRTSVEGDTIMVWTAMSGMVHRVVFKDRILMAYIFHERVSAGGDLTVKMSPL